MPGDCPISWGFMRVARIDGTSGAGQGIFAEGRVRVSPPRSGVGIRSPSYR